MRRSPLVTAIALSLVLVMVTILPVLGQATTKQLSTNFTLVNLGDGQADGTISYLKPDGSVWGDSGGEDFTIVNPGGQAIFRQYYAAGQPGNPNLTDGNGSVVIESSQPLGAVVQILARGQNPTSSGAYSGFTEGDTSYNIPLAGRKLPGLSGQSNSQIIVQNTGTSAANIEIEMVNVDGTSRYTDSESGLAAGASYYYDLNLESASNVPDGWYGSAVARTTTGGASIAVVSNYITADAMQTFNAFNSSAGSTTNYVPLFTSRLANSLSTPLAVQNVSGGTIATGGIDVECTPDPALSGYVPFTVSNLAPVLNTASFFVNPAIDMGIAEGFYGSCVITSSADVVSFVQMRYIVSGEAASYEAIPGGSTETTAFIPLAAKRLGNGFATAVTIQNLSSSTVTMDLTYIPSPDYTGSATPVEILGVSVGPYASLIQNHKVTSGAGSVPSLPDGWYGTLVVESDEAVDSFVQLTMVWGAPAGDSFMAHNGFVQ